ncbi:uncharacterized protein BO87DRAFT_434624 [Aspergillus neoniger CBS 115656]|uniref:NAD-dependent epimerase/dehydratase domain-containing protein n=1 Tax=Aspergillus neoniger (strain CBS 115656) TaxID=1448310 RepID=A0A318Z4G9_ASPNB|nr:hypothetical protein BO87DRAFT_434624 [Aspergillus neoniger CBS 115656]PYH35078.1 hypothetical protein BO87DRAFT_434624 [Aspergillus neoniger CBS 115656]
MLRIVEVGVTGLVGSHILTTLLAQPSISTVHAYTRKDIPAANPKLTAIHNKDSTTWSSLFPNNTHIFFSALGTTLAQAGSLENQRKIDLNLNLELAQAAKNAGVETYVLISSGQPNVNSRLAFLRMKGELVEAVKNLGFKHTIILHPGLIVGDRRDSRPMEAVVRGIASYLGKFQNGALMHPWAQHAEIIAGVAVSAGLQAAVGKREPGVWALQQADIVRLGFTEWNEPVERGEGQISA